MSARPVPERVDVLGVGVSVVDLASAVQEVGHWIEDGEHRYVCVTNVHCVMECQRDPELMEVHNRSGLTLPDGSPLTWAGRWAGTPMGRVRGSDFLLAVSREAATKGWSCFFYGAAAGTAEAVAASLVSRFPGLVVAGCHSPPYRPLTDEEDQRVVDMINDSGAQIVWVSLSAPKQERWAAAHSSRLDANVIAGVGAAFDFHAGLVREAPPWVRSAGLEWAHRLWSEPRRLWRRYAWSNPAFVAAVLRHPPRRSSTRR